MKRNDQIMCCGLLRGVLFLALLSAAGCLQTANPTPPLPQHPAEQAAREAMVAYAQHLADSFDAAGNELQSEKLKSAADVNQHLQLSNAAARKQAFHQLDEILNEELGGEKWDAERARQLFQHISTGLRSFP